MPKKSFLHYALQDSLNSRDPYIFSKLILSLVRLYKFLEKTFKSIQWQATHRHCWRQMRESPASRARSWKLAIQTKARPSWHTRELSGMRGQMGSRGSGTSSHTPETWLVRVWGRREGLLISYYFKSSQTRLKYCRHMA